MMAIVEHLGVPTWAAKINVRLDAETLVVLGEGRKAMPVPAGQLTLGEDMLRQYTEYSRQWSEGRTGKRSPHIQFANASNDDELVAFVRRFGPIQADGSLMERPNGMIMARQDLPGLRRDHLMFKGAMKLVVGLGDDDSKEVNGIADGLTEMFRAALEPGPTSEIHTAPEFRSCQWYGNTILRFANSLLVQGGPVLAPGQIHLQSIGDLHSMEAIRVRRIGQLGLAVLLNSFAPELVPVGNRMMELPVYDPCRILPVLYFMLRQDVLRKQAIAICERPECGAFFAVERAGSRFCSPECSQLQRQRDYWQRKGKEARAVRVARKRKMKGGKKRGTI